MIHDLTLSSSNQKQRRKKRWNQKFCQSHFRTFSNLATSGFALGETHFRFISDVSFRISYLYYTIFPKKYPKLAPNIRHDNWYFLLNNKIHDNWNPKFHLESLRMYYVINEGNQPSGNLSVSDWKYSCGELVLLLTIVYCTTATVILGHKILKNFRVKKFQYSRIIFWNLLMEPGFEIT